MIVLIGASASGKTTIAKELIEEYHFEKVITYTTRKMRIGEIDGVDYHFISQKAFKEKEKNQEFVETSKYSQNYYGTSFNEINTNKVLIVEVNGANKIYQKIKNQAMYVFLVTSKETRKARMIARKDDPVQIDKRLEEDDKIFCVDNILYLDYIINAENRNISDITKEIYDLYQLRSKK